VLGLLVGLLSLYAEAQAQEIEGGKGRWQITPSISLYEMYTDNVDLVSEDPVGSYITEFSPGLLFQLPSSRRQIRINTDLKLDYRNRDDGDVETLYWYNFFGYLGHQYSPRTIYELNIGYDIYYTETDISAPFVNVFSEMTRSDVFYIQPGVSYNVTKTTTAKLGARYGFSKYKEPTAPDAEDMEGSLFVTQKVGSRITVGTGYTYRTLSQENETGYTEHQIPIQLSLDLTYIQLNLKSAYVTRSYESRAGYPDKSFSDETFFLYGVGFELGGQLLRLRSTTLELNYETNYYDDIYGYPYENQELRVSLYHAFKKFDFYTDIKYGINEYTQRDDEITYWGIGSGLKWYATSKAYMNFNLDYTNYDYQLLGVAGGASTYDVINGSIDYNYSIYDWLYVGLGYGHRESSSSVDTGNYSENFYSLFAKATW
jgi:hypothetical protein